MPHPSWHIFPNSEAVAAAFAAFLAKTVRPDQPFHLALSGGSTPKLLFSHLAEHYAEKIPWEQVHFWWGDERCVPPEDAESNYRMTRERLFEPLCLHGPQIHRILGEAEPEAEASRYGAEIEAALPAENGQPVFDLIMLGMGEDGHTASIFPDQMDLLTAAATCAVATHPESGQQRVSLTGPVLNAARQVAFLVTGAGKAPKVTAIREGKPEREAWPAAHIDPRGDLMWFLDAAAAGQEA
jgi:6-phosphogluconolactonase